MARLSKREMKKLRAAQRNANRQNANNDRRAAGDAAHARAARAEREQIRRAEAARRSELARLIGEQSAQDTQRPRWSGQIARVESNRDGAFHRSPHTPDQRAQAFGRVKITAKHDATCQATRLGVECGNPITKGRRAWWNPREHKIECLECWR